jgi:hypothetical protein
MKFWLHLTEATGGLAAKTMGKMVCPSMRRLSSMMEVRLFLKSISATFCWSIILEEELAWIEVVDLEERMFLTGLLELREERRRLPMLCFFSFFMVSNLASKEPIEVTDGWASWRVEVEWSCCFEGDVDISTGM